MRTISVQQMPNGFEVDVPTFGYWFKAGFAFTLGAGAVGIVAALIWLPVSLALISAMPRLLFR